MLKSNHIKSSTAQGGFINGGLLRAFFKSPDAVGREEFIAAMRGAASGVNIVTTDGPAGQFGLTVSAFSSVSAEPPSVLVCINRASPACAAIRDNGRFCVNLLSTEQRPLADTFAGMPADGEPYDFGSATWRHADGRSPMLEEAVASFDCEVQTAIDAGTHTIFIGLVNGVRQSGRAPLLYTNRSYRRACCAA